MTRYRKTFRAALEEVYLSEKEISKLKNGVKVLGNALPSRMIAQKAADKANKEMGVDADVYQSPFNNRFYVRIKEENISEQEKDHEISMARGELEAIADKAIKLSSMLQGKSDDGNPLEAWVQSKITKAKDYINSVSDYMEYNPENANEETITEKSFTSQQIKMAYGVANDKRYKAGNYSGAVAAIEKIAKGLSQHPDVLKVLKRVNEDTELDKLKEDVAKMFETHSYMTNKMNKKQMDAKGEETPVKKESMADMWSKSAETIEKIKSEAKYMKSDDESPKEKVGETLVGTKKTKVETEPKVDYQK